MIYGLKLLQRGRNSTNDDINTTKNKNTNLNNMDDSPIHRFLSLRQGSLNYFHEGRI